MLGSFADLVALSPQQFTRPKIVSSGISANTNSNKVNVNEPMVIKAGRHPVIATNTTQVISSISSFKPNDLFLTPLDNLLVITGANGSGKSVYIKQVALITIVAQIGCYVPARHATIPVRDRILSRIANHDDMEHNMSTFMTEMKEIAYILDNLSDCALVVVDELGRGTSNVDGMYNLLSFLMLLFMLLMMMVMRWQ